MLRKRTSLRGVSLKYLKCTENDTSTDSMLRNIGETVHESNHGEYDSSLFFQKFYEFAECSTLTNTECGNQCDLAEINRSFSSVE